ncbi:MAG: class I SAM-dependent methyltransferase [Anaerolineae bacterium]
MINSWPSGLSLLGNAPRAQRKAQAHHDYRIFQALQARLEKYLGDLQGKRVLDVGCGRTYPFTLLLHSLGAHVTGIDLEFIPRGWRSWWHVLRRAGAREVLSRLATWWALDRPYHRELEGAAGFPLKAEGLDLRQMDAACLDFEGGAFDLAVSNAAFEHFPDVPRVLAELRRVLKPQGILHVEIHLFPSLTGGHNVPCLPGGGGIELGDTPPWDHLRQNLRPAPVYLNRLREREYREMFEAHFRVLEWQTEFEEPAHLLTPDLEAELAAAGYSREELLKRSVVVVAAPKR